VGLFKITRRDFYECGFRPQSQQAIRLPLQFLLICIFFLLYDIELLFLFPFIANATNFGMLDIVLVGFYLFFIIYSLYIDYQKHALF